MTTPSTEGNVDISINTEELKLALEKEKAQPKERPESSKAADDDMGGTGGGNAGGAG